MLAVGVRGHFLSLSLSLSLSQTTETTARYRLRERPVKRPVKPKQPSASFVQILRFYLELVVEFRRQQ